MAEVTLLYHAKTIGYICERIARESKGKIEALCDRQVLPKKIKGTVIRWDSRESVEADQTLNTAEAVLLSRNKRESRIRMGKLCPPTWTHFDDLEYPCLIRPRRHYAAHKFFVCHTGKEAKRSIAMCGLRRYYASPIIDKKLEYRVFGLQDHILKVVRRFHDDPKQVAWNIANGGRSVRLKHDSWPIEVVKRALLAGRALGLDWFAADVIVDNQDRPFVLELNTAPGLQREATIENLVEVFTWAVEHKPPPLNDLKGDSWDDYIHPALL